MPRPRAGYQLNGESVVGVTTVTSGLDWGKSGRLMAWAAKEVRAGRDPFKSRDRAADAGTVAHALIEAHLLGTKADLSGYDKEVVDKGENAFINFMTWAEAYQLKPRSIEEPLVSPKLRCGTTPDLIAFIKDRLSLIDWKSGGTYETSFIELAARRVIWEELHPDEPITGGFHIIKINRETGAFDHHWRESLDGCFEAFLCLLELYELKSKIKKYL
jgi:hypothetical protein